MAGYYKAKGAQISSSVEYSLKSNGLRLHGYFCFCSIRPAIFFPAEISLTQGEASVSQDSGTSEVVTPPVQLQAIADILALQLASTLTVVEF